MALQTSGAISLNDIHIEAGGTTGTLASINDADIRALIGKASGVTMSFSEWYGASSLIELTAQSSVLSTSATVTTPSFAAGDIAIATIFGLRFDQLTGAPYGINTPSGWTLITQTSQYSTGPFTKGEYFVNSRMLICYKVLTSGDTSFTNSASLGSMTWRTTVQVYRPSATISTVTVNDLTTTSSNTINCSGAGASVIAFGGNHGDVTATQTWGAGPTYTDAWSVNLSYDIHYGRAGSYVQSTATPSDVTWSANGSRYASGYLKVT